jgi:hypothetical protein
MIKAITKGAMYPVSIGDGTDLKDAAVAFRATSNNLTFIKTKYNASGVHTNTDKASQIIFMDSTFNAQFDVNVLASAFNMDKADFMGRLHLIDDWTTFDNDRFSTIMDNSDMIEEVTDAELAIMANVKAVLVDEEWFQVYDNQNKFTEKYVASGEYWNYFYNVLKTVSSSPFSNAVVFVTSSATITAPASLTFKVANISGDANASVVTLEPTGDAALVGKDGYKFVQTSTDTENGVAVHPYGAYIIPVEETPLEVTFTATLLGETYAAASAVGVADLSVGDTVTLAKQ